MSLARTLRTRSKQPERRKPISRCLQGFILDGFPRTEQQAKELEKALTGLNVAAEEAYAAGASRVAPPGAAAFLSPSRPIKSCLDTVVVLELENSEVAVERAVGRRMDPETGKIYHMQLSPPPGDAPGLLERLIPVTSPSNDTEQLQKRLQVLRLAPWMGEGRLSEPCMRPHWQCWLLPCGWAGLCCDRLAVFSLGDLVPCVSCAAMS